MIAMQLARSRQLSFWMRELDSRWSLTETRARVVEIIRETHDVMTFVLAPNRRWRGHEAGQFVPVEVEVDGVRTTRCYSLSSAPGDDRLHITVKRVPGGRVSAWMHEHLSRGDVVTLGEAAGELCLAPASGPQRLLLLSGGSGVTPLMSILRELAARDAIGDVVFVHAARSRRDVIFERDLSELAARHKGLRVVFVLEDDAAGGGRLDGAKLAALVPDLAERETKLCGPSGMMDALSMFYRNQGLAHLLQMERFGPPARVSQSLSDTPERAPAKLSLTLLQSERVVSIDAGGTMLEQLERAGERPANGCRMGICNTCLCRKRSGVTEDITTGVLSEEPDQDIRLCVSRARTNVSLAL